MAVPGDNKWRLKTRPAREAGEGRLPPAWTRPGSAQAVL